MSRRLLIFASTMFLAGGVSTTAMFLFFYSPTCLSQGPCQPRSGATSLFVSAIASYVVATFTFIGSCRMDDDDKLPTHHQSPAASSSTISTTISSSQSSSLMHSSSGSEWSPYLPPLRKPNSKSNQPPVTLSNYYKNAITEVPSSSPFHMSEFDPRPSSLRVVVRNTTVTSFPTPVGRPKPRSQPIRDTVFRFTSPLSERARALNFFCRSPVMQLEDYEKS